MPTCTTAWCMGGVGWGERTELGFGAHQSGAGAERLLLSHPHRADLALSFIALHPLHPLQGGYSVWCGKDKWCNPTALTDDQPICSSSPPPTPPSETCTAGEWSCLDDE